MMEYFFMGGFEIMLPFRWKAETGWSSGWAEESMGFWQREIRERFIFRERDIWGLTGADRGKLG